MSEKRYEVKGEEITHLEITLLVNAIPNFQNSVNHDDTEATPWSVYEMRTENQKTKKDEVWVCMEVYFD